MVVKVAIAILAHKFCVSDTARTDTKLILIRVVKLVSVTKNQIVLLL